MGAFEDREWIERAACAPRNRTPEIEKLDWYSSDQIEKYAARAVCMNRCPVRRECISDALGNKDIWGIHGGVDDYEIRRTLSVDSDGEPTTRTRLPRCPYCLNRKLDISGTRTGARGYHTRCQACGLEWYMAAIPAKLRTKKTTR